MQNNNYSLTGLSILKPSALL